MSWIQRAKPGDKVVCVDATPFYRGHSTGLVIGAVYEIAEIRFGLGRRPTGEIIEEAAFRLVGWVHPEPRPSLGGAIGAWRFRPVETRPTSISIFTDMLNTVGKQLEVETV